MPARAAIVLALLVALLAAGCGNDTEKKNDYVNAVNAAQTRFQQTFDRLQSEITATSTPAQDRKTLGRFKVAVDRVIADFKAIKPPSEVADLHRRLVVAVGDYRPAIADATQGYKSNDPRKILAASTRFARAVKGVGDRITATINQINQKLHE